MDDHDKPQDESPGALYRALPRDEPPAAIDAAVLEAARRSVGTRPDRKWAAPVALAAVLVLSVGVSLRIADERPDAQFKQAAPPAAPSAAKPSASQPPPPLAVESNAKPADARAGAVAVAPSANAPARMSKAQSEPESKTEAAGVPQEGRAKGAIAAEERAAESADAPGVASSSAPVSAPAPQTGFVPSPRADSAQTASRPALRSESLGGAEARAPKLTQGAAAESSRAMAATTSPAAWLDRIAEMRTQGRHKEADESYAEFRQRYPDYTISPEVLRKIAPPR